MGGTRCLLGLPFPAWAAVLSALGSPGAGGAKSSKPVHVAIIVHAKNATMDVSLKELRSIFTLEQQFWPKGGRILLLQRPSRSQEGQAVLNRVYSMTEDQLRKHWVQKLFSSEIPAIPAVVRQTDAAVASSKKNEGAITAVLAGELPEGVRVLTIDGKRPGDEGYPLVWPEESS